jgi:hypothetical protein
VEAALRWPVEEGSCTDEFLVSLGIEGGNQSEKKDEGGLTGSPCVRRNRWLKLLRSLKKNGKGTQASALYRRRDVTGLKALASVTHDVAKVLL